MTTLGIDIGGSGIKGAPVDVSSGTLTQERYRVVTPHPAGVKKVVAAVAEVAAHFNAAREPNIRHSGDAREPNIKHSREAKANGDRVGITFPGVVIGGVTRTAANVDPSWLDAPAAELFSEAIGRPVTVLNDADAAGVAEMTFGAGRGQAGVTVMLTFGTGIGSAVFLDGRLVPNTELGHIELHGDDAELRASDRIREQDGMGWHKWAARVQEYLAHLEALLRPDLLIIGGGVSKKADKFLPLIDIRTPVVAATLQNEAGIVGAAIAAAGRT